MRKQYCILSVCNATDISYRKRSASFRRWGLSTRFQFSGHVHQSVSVDCSDDILECTLVLEPLTGFMVFWKFLRSFSKPNAEGKPIKRRINCWASSSALWNTKPFLFSWTSSGRLETHEQRSNFRPSSYLPFKIQSADRKTTPKHINNFHRQVKGRGA